MGGNFGEGFYAFLAVVTVCIAQFLRIYRWKLMVYKEGEISNRILSRSIGISYLANLLVPLRLGELARIYYLKRKKFGIFPTTFAVVLERMFDSILITTLFVAYSLIGKEDNLNFLVTPVIILSILALILYLVIKPREHKLKMLRYFSSDLQLKLNHIIFQVYLVFSRVKMNLLPILGLSILINTGIFFSILFFASAMSIDTMKISQIIIFELSNSISTALIELANISNKITFSVLYLLLPIFFMIFPSFRETRTRKADETKIELDKTRNLVLPVTETYSNAEYIKLAVSNIASAGIKGLSKIQMETLRGEKLIEVLQGGSSGDQVFLIEKNGVEKVRKSASELRREFLLEQNKWMREYAELVPLVSAAPIEITQNAAYYDMEYMGKDSGFFESLHTNGIEESIFMLNELLVKLNSTSRTIENTNSGKSYADLYAKKVERCFEMVKSLNLQSLLDQRLLFENKELLSINLEPFMSFLSKQELPPEENWLLHGDLTVSNMLVSNDKIKLIDPNPLQPFVHPTVDFGKLLQSFKCGYEFDFMNVRLIGKNMNMKILNTRSVAYAEMEDFLYSWIERNYHENYGYHARIQLLLHLFRIIPYAKNSEQVCWIVFHARIVFTELKSV